MTVDETYSAGKQRCERGDTNPESNLVGQPPDAWKRSTRVKDSFDEKATLLMRATTSRSNDHLQGPKWSMRTEVTPNEKATSLIKQRPAGQTTIHRDQKRSTRMEGTPGEKATPLTGQYPPDPTTTRWSNHRPETESSLHERK